MLLSIPSIALVIESALNFKNVQKYSFKKFRIPALDLEELKRIHFIILVKKFNSQLA